MYELNSVRAGEVDSLTFLKIHSQWLDVRVALEYWIAKKHHATRNHVTLPRLVSILEAERYSVCALSDTRVDIFYRFHRTAIFDVDVGVECFMKKKTVKNNP